MADAVHDKSSGTLGRVPDLSELVKQEASSVLEQSAREFHRYLHFLKNINCRHYLEIGSAAGVNLRAVAQTLGSGAHITAVDWPRDEKTKIKLQHSLDGLDVDFHLIVGDSRRDDVIEQAEQRAPFDVVFIDGDHRYESAKHDFLHYGHLAPHVCFHDISFDQPGSIEVNRLWAELRDLPADFTEIIRTPGRYGIGIMSWKKGNHAK